MPPINTPPPNQPLTKGTICDNERLSNITWNYWYSSIGSMNKLDFSNIHVNLHMHSVLKPKVWWNCIAGESQLQCGEGCAHICAHNTMEWWAIHWTYFHIVQPQWLQLMSWIGEHWNWNWQYQLVAQWSHVINSRGLGKVADLYWMPKINKQEPDV